MEEIDYELFTKISEITFQPVDVTLARMINQDHPDLW